MNTPQLLEVPLKTRLFCKLNPSRFPRMSGVMAAIVGHLLDAPLGDPRIVEIAVTSDGLVLGRTDAGLDHFIGNYGDLIRNWSALLSVAGLTATERFEADVLFAEKIGYFGATTA
jgi:hypothetical protein